MRDLVIMLVLCTFAVPYFEGLRRFARFAERQRKLRSFHRIKRLRGGGE